MQLRVDLVTKIQLWYDQNCRYLLIGQLHEAKKKEDSIMPLLNHMIMELLKT